ncbi:hypothetical protein EVAR_49875_1 [Eumeta japonica]|uniref:Nucleic-acid-binding protein from transposon X-element n=1 Tax=Eumeta variegata TaxID=151549 RepID=A0A4C1XVC0_EUMVA|nr:hypothetical protein EVAR_49875_1 [Eumeta japonica]
MHPSTPRRRKHPGCLDHLDREVNVILRVPGITVEARRGQPGPPQYHRCQKFHHASALYYRLQQCVRCEGKLYVADCPHPREQNPTYANSTGQHTTNDRRCPVFCRETHRRELKIPPKMATITADILPTHRGCPRSRFEAADSHVPRQPLEPSVRPRSSSAPHACTPIDSIALRDTPAKERFDEME